MTSRQIRTREECRAASATLLPFPGGTNRQIVVAGAGYAGLHVAMRLAARLRNNPVVELTLVDRHDYHQVLTELLEVMAHGCLGAAPAPVSELSLTS